MANLNKNANLLTPRNWVRIGGRSYVAGHNRTFDSTMHDGKLVVICYLHGHPIVEAAFTEDRKAIHIGLDTCGYLTVTTQSAMRDFLGAIGVSAGVGRAKGELSVRYRDETGAFREVVDPDGEALEFTISLEALK